jgi:hypothetical protein
MSGSYNILEHLFGSRSYAVNNKINILNHSQSIIEDSYTFFSNPKYDIYL